MRYSLSLPPEGVTDGHVTHIIARNRRKVTIYFFTCVLLQFCVWQVNSLSSFSGKSLQRQFSVVLSSYGRQLVLKNLCWEQWCCRIDYWYLSRQIHTTCFNGSRLIHALYWNMNIDNSNATCLNCVTVWRRPWKMCALCKHKTGEKASGIGPT